MNMLSRRLPKIETVLMPAPARPVVLLAAPPECANEAMRENYRDELAAARQSGALIVIVAERGDVHEPGCKIVRSYLDGWAEVLAASPSTEGRADALADALANLGGNVIRPGMAVDFDDDEA